MTKGVNIDYGHLKPVNLTDEQKFELEFIMLCSFEVLSEEAKMLGVSKIVKLRDDFKKGKISLSQDAVIAIENMKDIEEITIAAFIKLGNSLYNSFAKVVSTEDCVQEGMLAIYDAMYTYNGSNRFSTYANCCIKNRVIALYRVEAKKEQNIHVMCMDEFGNDEDVVAKEFELMRETIKITPLNPLERTIVEGKLLRGRDFTNDFMESPESIKPSTGKRMTRQRVSQIYIKACEKLKMSYNNRRAA